MGVRAGLAAPRAYRPGRRISLPTALAALVVLAGVGYRLALLLADAPPTNSDEATMGLAALHIARGEHFPVWFYGQAYMGTLEAYLAAPLVALTGPSVLALRLPTLALYALFLALSWRLTRRLGGDHWFALLVVGFLALGSDRVVKNQLIAGGGYPELNPAGVGLALLTVALCADRTTARLPRWGAWGLVTGLMLWVDPLLLPYALGLGAVLVVRRRRELAGRAGLVVAAVLLLGAAPILLDSLRHRRNPLTAVLAAGGGEAASWGERLYGGLVLGPPLGMGFCSPGHCAGWQLWWALAFPLLLLLAGLTAWRTLRRPLPPADRGQLSFAGNGKRPRSGDDPRGPEGRRVSAAVRLALLAGAAAVLAAYTLSTAAGRTPVESSRYLSCLAVATPALLWPLWRAARRAGPRGRRPRRVGLAAVAVLAAILGTAGIATAGAIAGGSATHAEADRHRALVDALAGLGVRHVRGGYWTCNRLTFATGEDVVCAVVDDDLHPGFDRLPGYRRAVAADPGAAWVAPVGSPLAARLDGRVGPGRHALDVVTVEGWRIYLPRR
ncbi:DUF423 domain-containing protein [Micromonospora yasonensis]|uniref:DUF423 domain-containing protein n=1 Tax=Micromonospora yasonensis TaxID=1128667 RepID=UPI00222E35EF|nr:DUF423 domain-containing protein [Micromonospora yasonensis]MCW3843610.1 DUF423 domain-containing protein [Micromonospora yasonensis]